MSPSFATEDGDRAIALAKQGVEKIRSGLMQSGICLLREAVEYAPDSAAILHNLADGLQAIGLADDGIEFARRAYLADPTIEATQSGLLLALLYSPTLPPEAIADAYRGWGRLFEPTPSAPVPERGTRLRIGYLSSNFCANPEYYYLEPVMRFHDRDRFKIFSYAHVTHEDEQTVAFRRASDHWRDIRTLNDRQAADVIQGDRIDILVDCSGHFASSRIRILALNPAPIQVSYPTHPATTGLATVSYRITDGLADPPGMTEHLHTESLVRLAGGFVCYAGPGAAGGTGEPPAVRNGFITFGCFNRFHKVNEPLVDLWAAVLEATPRSRMLLHHSFGGQVKPTGEYCETILRWFDSRGIDAERISFAGARPLVQHLHLHREIDITLDTFPYNGMTTTCASLWMGVPVVTLAGRAHVSRTATSLLNSVKLTDWIVESPEEYVRVATQKAGDISDLVRLRKEIRDRMQSSVLGNAREYTLDLEMAYVKMAEG